MDSDSSDTPQESDCPICQKKFPIDQIEVHVNRCIFLNSTVVTSPAASDHKRTFGVFEPRSSSELKRPKLSESPSSRNRKPAGSAWHKKATAQVVTLTLSDDDTEPTTQNNVRIEQKMLFCKLSILLFVF